MQAKFIKEEINPLRPKTEDEIRWAMYNKYPDEYDKTEDLLKQLHAVGGSGKLTEWNDELLISITSWDVTTENIENSYFDGLIFFTKKDAEEFANILQKSEIVIGKNRGTIVVGKNRGNITITETEEWDDYYPNQIEKIIKIIKNGSELPKKYNKIS